MLVSIGALPPEAIKEPDPEPEILDELRPG